MPVLQVHVAHCSIWHVGTMYIRQLQVLWFAIVYISSGMKTLKKEYSDTKSNNHMFFTGEISLNSFSIDRSVWRLSILPSSNILPSKKKP